MQDSQDLASLARGGGGAQRSSITGGGHHSAAGHGSGLKLLLFVFVLFLLVNSDVFVNNVLCGLGGAVEGRNPTAYGTVVQGIVLVIGLILLTKVSEMQLL